MTLGTIELADHEVFPLKQIDFNQQFHESLEQSCEASAQLMPLLLQRKAIPAQRLRYFDDPELNGGKKSRMQVFEGNGTALQELLSLVALACPTRLSRLSWLSVQSTVADG
jgi:hypothetical protein